MKLNLECLSCNIDQVIKITNLLDLDNDTREKIMRRVLGYLKDVDYEQTNPEVMKGTWDIITREIGDNNPYRNLKAFYNQHVESISDKIIGIIEKSDKKVHTALKVAIAGNLIDFASGHQFDEKMLVEDIENIKSRKFGKDDSNELIKRVLASKSMLYLGDNCGEIVLDKIFISYLKDINPNLKVIYGVRGKSIINDVTDEDARMVRISEVARVISNGDGSLGTVLKNTTSEFQDEFWHADIVIAKGQGNFESLSDEGKDNLFFLFMAKCEVVAKIIGVKKGQIVCAKHTLFQNKGDALV